MQVQNVSTRLHHVGAVAIAPGETKEIPKEFEKSINTDELKPVKADAKKAD